MGTQENTVSAHVAYVEIYHANKAVYSKRDTQNQEERTNKVRGTHAEHP